MTLWQVRSGQRARGSGRPTGRLPVLSGPRGPCAGHGARWPPHGAPLISVQESVLSFSSLGRTRRTSMGQEGSIPVFVF